MCGRFLLDSEIRDIIKSYNIEKTSLENYTLGDYYPNLFAPLIIDDGARILGSGKWGIKYSEVRKPAINARSETVFEKPTFKSAFHRRRCIIPATLFYEWKSEDNGNKTKFTIKHNKTKILSLGGIYNFQVNKQLEKIISFAIITTNANEGMSKIHHRMPLIVNDENIDTWLNGNSPINEVTKLLVPSENKILDIRKWEIEHKTSSSSDRYEQMRFF